MILECSVESCERASRSRGLCNPHYLRWRRYGDPCASVRTICRCGECRACKHREAVRLHRQPLPCRDCGGPKGRGQKYRCASCQAVYLGSLWDETARKRYQHDRNLRSKYGITIDDYDQMLAKQSGVCAICAGPQNKKFLHFDVDHDKTSGLIRGLLCRRCNTGLGYLEADFHIAGLAYLRRADPSS